MTPSSIRAPYAPICKAILSPEDAGALADVAVQIGAYGARIDDGVIGCLLFTARRYQEVLKRLSNDENSEIYRDANALALIDQANLSPREYSDAEARIVADYYYRQREFEEACRLYRRIRDSGRVLECLRQSMQE